MSFRRFYWGYFLIFLWAIWIGLAATRPFRVVAQERSTPTRPLPPPERTMPPPQRATPTATAEAASPQPTAPPDQPTIDPSPTLPAVLPITGQADVFDRSWNLIGVSVVLGLVGLIAWTVGRQHRTSRQ